MFKNYFPKIVLFIRLCTAGQATDSNVVRRMRLACTIYYVVLWTTYITYLLVCSKDLVMRTAGV